MIQGKKPMNIEGEQMQKLPSERKVLWRNLCVIDTSQLECVVEFSKSPNKFNVCCYEIDRKLYHTIQLYAKQAQRILASLDNDYTNLM